MSITTPNPLSHRHRWLALGVAVPLWLWTGPLCAEPIGNPTEGLQIDIVVWEILASDPPEADIIDTMSAVIHFGLETTLRAGNAVLYLTATTVNDRAVRLEYALYVPGPVPDQRVDVTVLEYDVPLIVEDVKGKGKSSYRYVLAVSPADAPPTGVELPKVDGEWLVNPSANFLFRLHPHSLGVFHYLSLRRALDHDWEAIRDTFGLTAPGKTDFYFVEGLCQDVILDPRFDFAVDPSRNRIVARYDHQFTGVDIRAMLLTQLLRWWGYAPELLSIGASGFNTLADYSVLKDQAAGHSIPLERLARTLDFKRQPPAVADHHAISFCHWLIKTHGRSAFRDAYTRATDLSLERALWSVYGKTLAELEADWRAYLSRRKFSAIELYMHAIRAAGYRDYRLYYELLTESVARADTIPARIYRDLSLAAGQLGRWDDCARHARNAVALVPGEMSLRKLLGEALWAVGDTSGAEYQARVVLRTDPSDPGGYLLMGDVQTARRRLDSALTLWDAGLKRTGGSGVTHFELCLRVGRMLRERRNADSARVLFLSALTSAHQMLASNPHDPLGLARVGEAYAESDSVESALAYLDIAAYAADAPQDISRIALARGRALDLAGRRTEALESYEYVLSINAPNYDVAEARKYLNRVYGSR